MRKHAPLLHRLTVLAMIAIGMWGLVMALAPVHPFWIDEWRLIYNLKFKSSSELWGPLQFTQQFPRLYLASLKAFTQTCDYSYQSLRLPALLFSIGTIGLSWRIMRRLFPERADVLRPLFVLIIISSETFTYYLVQTKHYEAEIFLAVLAMWQALELLSIPKDGIRKPWLYGVLCVSMLAAPSFSYTYPIAITPVFFIMSIHALRLLKAGMRARLAAILCPLVLSACGILCFYLMDVRQLLSDQSMHHYWANRTADAGDRWQVLHSLWQFFASAGAGFVFEVIFSILGVAALVFWVLRFVLKQLPAHPVEWMQAYAALLLLLVVALFFAGKLPLGEAKFAAFCVPALSLLIVAFLMKVRERYSKPVAIAALILFVGLLGNIPVVIYRSFGEPEYGRRLAIYKATQRAIMAAQQADMPLLVTPGVAWPDEITHPVAFLETITADAVLKTFPAYSVKQALPVYAIADTADARRRLALLPANIQKVLVHDGEHSFWLSR